MTDYIKGPDGVAYYRHVRKGAAYVRPYIPGEDLSGVSVSDQDSPKRGDMIAVNPDNLNDRWLIDAAYFAKNFEVRK
jgi:hypothetical protein